MHAAGAGLAVWLVVMSAGGCGERAAPTRAATGDAAPPARVIALAPNAAEIICGLGGGGTLVGVSRFCTWPPQLDRVQKIGGLRDPDLEVILSLRPDLIVLRGRSGPLRQFCRERHIRSYEDRVETLDDLYRTIADLGRLLSLPGPATEMASAIRVDLKRVADRAATRDKVRVLFVVLRSPGAVADVMTTGGHTFLHELIEIAGGVNVFGDLDIRYPKVSLEEIVARSPQVIVETRPGGTISPSRRRALLAEWGPLSAVPAVRTGRVHFLTEQYITIPSQRVTRTARTLLSLFHPEIDGGG